MKIIKTPLVCSLIAILLSGIASAQVGEFSDDFTSATLDSTWTTSGVGGAFDADNDVYSMSPVNSTGSAKLQNFNTSGTLSDYTHVLSVDLVSFLNPNTRSDLKLKSFGANGFAEIVFNSFGDIRMYHNDNTSNGNVFTDKITIDDGESLTLKQVYSVNADTMTVSYSVDGGAEQSLYSGNGIDGSIGNIVSSFVEVEVGQFNGNAEADPVIHIDSWSLAVTAVPEPSTFALLAGCFGLTAVMLRRRRA